MIKEIDGFNGAYGCDEKGNVYSYRLQGSHDGKLTTCPKLMTPYSGTTSKYLCVGLSKDGITKNYLVHRLIAKTWIPNPNNLPEVDHIDANIYNNAVSNLQWIDRKDNLNKTNQDMGGLNGLRTKTKLYDPNNNFIAEFDSIRAAAKYASVNFGCSRTGMEKYKKTKNGYYIIPESNPKREAQAQKAKKQIWKLYSPTDELIESFPSIRSAGLYIKKNIRDISVKLFQVHKKAYGYYVINESVETKCTLGDEHQGEAPSLNDNVQ